MFTTTDPRRRPAGRRSAALSAVRRAVLARRRLLAALCAGLAVLTGISAARPAPPPSRPVVVAAHDVLAGTTLRADDLTLVRLPTATVPAHVAGSADEVVGETVAAPMRAGEPVTDLRIVHDVLLQGYGPGTVLSSVRIADPASVTGVRVGDAVDVIASDPSGDRAPGTLADGVQVASIVRPQDTIGVADAVVLRVAVDEATALALADAATQDALTVVVTAPTG